tara:strand:+ start:538 stop:714 length:177 start_codon:yes stop_codon:yes gene_type:complete
MDLVPDRIYLVELVRAPVLGHAPGALSWGVSLGMAVFGWLIAFFIYRKYQHRIAYWVI